MSIGVIEEDSDMTIEYPAQPKEMSDLAIQTSPELTKSPIIEKILTVPKI